jgi:hypothetical protein
MFIMHDDLANVCEIGLKSGGTAALLGVAGRRSSTTNSS